MSNQEVLNEEGLLEPPPLTLEEREAKWGFSLAELQAASKVVRVLFSNPSLFVGDPYLADSRLYTMITRDRNTKRENREVYKVIMNEERSRRRRYQRLQDEKAVKDTGMKREREEAMNAVLLEDESSRHRPFLLTESPSASPTEAEPTTSPTRGLSQQHRLLFQLVAAFEMIWRLEDAFEGRYSEAMVNACSGLDADQFHATVISQLIAHVYRYFPHAYGSQMPPPLLRGATLPHDDTEKPSPRQLNSFLFWTKYRIAELVEANVPLPAILSGAESEGWEKVVRSNEEVMVSFALPTRRGSSERIDSARQFFTWMCRSATGEPGVSREDFQWPAQEGIESPAAHFQSCSSETLLQSVKTVLLAEGDGKDNSASFFYACSQPPSAAAHHTLDLFILRRLYGAEIVRQHPPSPFMVEVKAPTSESEEPDLWTPFDDALTYTEATDSSDEKPELSKWVSCYICKIRYRRLHPYYYSMCHLCGEFNFNKRMLSSDLRGKAVLLTGCRIKIGYAMSLSLLRCGADLIGTTRFSHEALARFQEEPDYAEWKDRLHLFSLDLRDMRVTTQFCHFIRYHFPKLYAIVNNAAQTIARAPGYTAHLRAIEQDPPQQLLEAMAEHPRSSEWQQLFLHNTTVPIGVPMSLTGGDYQPPAIAAQPGGKSVLTNFDRYDTAAEESDTRSTNSWVQKLSEVTGSEAAEVMAINAISPFILNSLLKPCLTNREGESPNAPRFIINVSAMEGQFYRFKQVTHPHTNMAKAALNMMTRTSADDYAADHIYMNSVDTGWITDESPKDKKERRAQQFMLCPLDEVDAAARCLDLIYTQSTIHGKFFKDFKEILW